MGLIQVMRKRVTLVFGLIALAVVGFMVMDVMTGGRGGGMGRSTTMGKVNGTKIDYNEFTAAESARRSNESEPYSVRESIWEEMVSKIVLDGIASKLGIGVGKEELIDLQFGNNLSPLIQQRFANPSTGAVDRNQLKQIETAIKKNQLPADLRVYWAEQEKEIIKKRMQDKLESLVSKSLYVPGWLIQASARDMNSRIDLAFVRIPLDQIGDADLKLTDADYQEFMNKYKSFLNKDEEERILSYVTFIVNPSSADSMKIWESMYKSKADFAAAKNDSAFVLLHNGTFANTFQTKDQLGQFADTLMRQPVGSIFGPYLDNKVLKCAKIIGKNAVPDSVKSRHILISAKDPAALASADKKADSLRNLIQSGRMRFDSCAAKFSDDPGSKTKGGELGFATPGMYVPEFNDIVFYTGVPGKIYKVKTQFGVHLIEVLDKRTSGKSGLKAAFITEPMAPSEETQNAIRDEAEQLISKNRTLDALKKAISANPRLSVQEAQPSKVNDYNIQPIPPSQSGREAVRWAFDAKTKVGDVSPTVYEVQDRGTYYTSRYVVVGLQQVLPKGLPSIDQMKKIKDLDNGVRMMKRASLASEKLKGTTDLQAAAAKFAVKVDTAKGLSFNQAFLPNAGNEPKVVSAAYSLTPGKISNPIAGYNGGYVVQVIDRKEADLNDVQGLMTANRQLRQSAMGAVKGNLMNGLRKEANVKDFRNKFF